MFLIYWIDVDGSQDELMCQFGFELVLCVFVQGLNGSCYVIIFFGDCDVLIMELLYVVYYDVVYVFDFYF